MNLIALALLIAFAVTLAASRLRRWRCRLRWIESDVDVARTRSRSIRELALLAAERASHEDPYARDRNGQHCDRREARTDGLKAHERPGPEAIAEAIDERVDEALRFVLHLALDDGVESLARRLRGGEVTDAEQDLHACKDGQLRRELGHREPARPEPGPVDHRQR